MTKFLKALADYIFSFNTFLILIGCAFVYLLYLPILSSDIERQEQTRKQTEVCYSQGMVLISTGAGPRCVDPRALIKVPE